MAAIIDLLPAFTASNKGGDRVGRYIYPASLSLTGYRRRSAKAVL